MSTETDLRSIVLRVLNALPQAALIVSRAGRVALRNDLAASMLKAGDRTNSVLDGWSRSGADWQAEMAAMAEGSGRLIRRSIRLSGKRNRQLVVDIHLHQMGACLGLCPADPRPDDCPAPREAGGRAGEPPASQSRQPVDRSARGLARTDDSSQCVLMLIEDVAPRLSTERRLTAGERLAAAGTLAAKVAHELNNPLDGALRYIGLAQRVAGPEAGKYLANARTGLLRMAGIIRGLLGRGRAWQAAGEPVPVRRLLEEAITTMQPRADALGVTLVYDIDDQVGGAVEGCVFQVFCNIIKNAFDAMPDGGMLMIRLRPAGAQCLVEFADTGCGLPDGEAERIFEPFYTTKSPGDGSGLGLAICREIVGRLGGAIAAASRPEGGAVFSVRLPLRPPWQPAGQEG